MESARWTGQGEAGSAGDRRLQGTQEGSEWQPCPITQGGGLGLEKRTRHEAGGRERPGLSPGGRWAVGGLHQGGQGGFWGEGGTV